MHTQTKVIMIDTLHLFPETYDLMEKARDYFKLHTNGLIFRCDLDSCPRVKRALVCAVCVYVGVPGAIFVFLFFDFYFF